MQAAEWKSEGGLHLFVTIASLNIELRFTNWMRGAGYNQSKARVPKKDIFL